MRPNDRASVARATAVRVETPAGVAFARTSNVASAGARRAWATPRGAAIGDEPAGSVRAVSVSTSVVASTADKARRGIAARDGGA